MGDAASCGQQSSRTTHQLAARPYVTAASILLLNRLNPERINTHTLTTADLHFTRKTYACLYVCVCVLGLLCGCICHVRRERDVDLQRRNTLQSLNTSLFYSSSKRTKWSRYRKPALGFCGGNGEMLLNEFQQHICKDL